jgi:RNA polymerase sigma-70 factor (ECF subfamily)
MDEKKVVRLAQEGSEDAFAELVRSYQSKVFSMALSFTRNREAADDLAQEVFLKAYLALPKFRFKSEFGTWLYRISANHIKDYLRKKGKVREISLDEVRELASADQGQAVLIEEEKEAEARKSLVRELVESLPEKYRMIITLRDIQGLAYERISEILNLSPGTVDSRLFRARRMLRKKLIPYMDRQGGAYEMP